MNQSEGSNQTQVNGSTKVPALKNETFAQIVLKEKLLTEEMVNECLALLHPSSTHEDDKSLEEIMVQKGYLTQSIVSSLYLKRGFLRCPHCGKSTKLPPGKSMSKGKCPHCYQMILIPQKATESEDEAPSPQGGLEGQMLMAYKIQQCLGRGGMGAVYRAMHTRLNRAVAIKVMSAQMATHQEYIQRFFREARLAAQVNDPNLVQIFDVAEERGIYFIAMEFIDGVSLSKKVKDKGHLSLEESLAILESSARGLCALHVKDIVHRDIKPDNIMITHDGQVKLTDFGLAKETGENAGTTSAALTQAGALLGTPHFMSPEQCLGNPAGKPSDIYALGCTLYYMLTGNFSYSGGNALAILSQHATSPAPALPAVPQTVVELYQKMVAKKIADRYPDAPALLEHIQSCKSAFSVAQAAPVFVKPPSPPKSNSSKRLLAGISMILVCLLVLRLGWPMIKRKWGQPPATPAVGPVASNAGQEAKGTKPVEHTGVKPVQPSPTAATPGESTAPATTQTLPERTLEETETEPNSGESTAVEPSETEEFVDIEPTDPEANETPSSENAHFEKLQKAYDEWQVMAEKPGVDRRQVYNRCKILLAFHKGFLHKYPQSSHTRQVQRNLAKLEKRGKQWGSENRQKQPKNRKDLRKSNGQ